MIPGKLFKKKTSSNKWPGLTCLKWSESTKITFTSIALKMFGLFRMRTMTNFRLDKILLLIKSQPGAFEPPWLCPCALLFCFAQKRCNWDDHCFRADSAEKDRWCVQDSIDDHSSAGSSPCIWTVPLFFLNSPLAVTFPNLRGARFYFLIQRVPLSHLALLVSLFSKSLQSLGTSLADRCNPTLSSIHFSTSYYPANCPANPPLIPDSFIIL